MKRIRTKLILSLLVITLLPVYPVYYLVKHLLRQSLEVGYNENVENALESAAQLSRELYAEYRQETLSFVERLARSRWILNFYENDTSLRDMDPMLLSSQSGKLDLFTLEGKLLRTKSEPSDHPYPMLFQNTIARLAEKDTPEILVVSDDTRHIIAFAPVFDWQGLRIGSLVFTRIVDEEVVNSSKTVIRVNQMFKTLTFFEGEVTTGFLFSFFAVYLPIAALSIGLGIYFSRRITSPLLSLVKGTKRVAEGDWDYRVKTTSRDEVGDLVEAFNTMIGNLKEKQDQVVALEKMAAWREIARVLAHEIKNPLTPIQLTVQQIKDKYYGDNEDYRKLLEECSQIVSDEIESLRALVREFSEFARMPKLSLAPGDINELVEEIVKLYPNDNITFKAAEKLPQLNFDFEKMRRVLINLIENGLDSIEEKGSGEIHISTDIDDDFAVIRYNDTGKGIPGELKTKIFEPYFSTKKSGMGLGLAIVKRVIDEHGGKIAVESVEGQGSLFVLKLPIGLGKESTGH